MTATVVLVLNQGVLVGLAIAAGCFVVVGWQARRSHDLYRRRHGHPRRWHHSRPDDRKRVGW